MNIAIIPARGGSQRIPRKNSKLFCGKPIIAYSIEAAKKSKLFDRILVSTDDEEIKSIAISYGAEVPFLRPENLSNNYTGIKEVVDHSLDWLAINNKSVDYAYCCTLLATAPFLQCGYLEEGLNNLKRSNLVNSFSACKMPSPIQRSFKLTREGTCKMLMPEHFNSRSQDLEDYYQDAGQFYWKKLGVASSDVLFDTNSIPVMLPSYLVRDIDTLDDWKSAELMYKALEENV
jgi:N-acylneuraminate cytidylyltransferase